MTKPKRSKVAPLTVDTLRLVTGGEDTPPRDTSSGLATGKRQHLPLYY